jgi:hypothetical protein
VTLVPVAITDDDVTAEPPADGPSPDEAPPQRGSRILRWFGALTVLSFVGIWGYVLILAFVFGRQPPVDRIEDPAFAEAAEARCAEAVATVGELPIATETPTPRERAVVLDEANDTYALMLDDLADLTRLIPDPADLERAEAWLADWHIFLGDRRDHTDRLHAGEDSRLLISPKQGEGRHITGWIDEFALANRMDSCVSPDDA